jgi:ppGpp synthetase/RelA/SpoT-type nucleotidyltranferase
MKRQGPPTLEDVKLCLRPHIMQINKANYSVQDIFECVKAYDQRRTAYKVLLERIEDVLKRARSLQDKVHSVRARRKDYYHLIDKLRRKCLDKEVIIKPNNLFKLESGVTDLGGFRILHLYKSQWRDVHEFLVSRFQRRVNAKIVKYEAKIRPTEKRDSYRISSPKYRKRGFLDCEIDDNTKNGYTSLHYVFKFEHEGGFEDLYLECQVRTLFEEGWGEIDHQRKYPHEADDLTSAQLSLLNKAAGIADGIASSFDELDRFPVIVPWTREQEYERAAKYVRVLSRDLKWASKHLDSLLKQLEDSETFFDYFYLQDSVAEKNAEQIRAKCARYLDKRLKVRCVRNNDIKQYPFFSDILLLEDTVDIQRREEISCAVIGTPTDGRIPDAQQLDMLIRNDDHVQVLKTLFKKLADWAE